MSTAVRKCTTCTISYLDPLLQGLAWIVTPQQSGFKIGTEIDNYREKCLYFLEQDVRQIGRCIYNDIPPPSPCEACKYYVVGSNIITNARECDYAVAQTKHHCEHCNFQDFSIRWELIDGREP